MTPQAFHLLIWGSERILPGTGATMMKHGSCPLKLLEVSRWGEGIGVLGGPEQWAVGRFQGGS